MQSTKRLLIVANRFYPQVGGAELVTFHEAQELAKRLQVDVITPLRDNDKRREAIDGFTIRRVWNANNPRNRFPFLPGNTLCPSIPAAILSGKYDLVHCFPAMNRNNILALLAARMRRIPIFLTCFDAFDYADLIQNKGVPLADLAKLTLPSRHFRYLGKFNAIFTISERETRLLKAANPNTFLSTVPITMDEHEQTPDVEAFRRKFGIAADEKVVLTLSRVAYIKGQDILVKTVPLFKDRVNKVRVIIAGRSDYEPAYIEGMKTFVKENGLENTVLFTGSLSREDALAALKTCDVHVLPMRFMNSGAVVAESWASEKPVIQSSMVDPNYVVEGENGFTFDVENKQDLADKIVYILQHVEESKTMGKNGFDLVQRKLLYTHLADHYMDIYREYAPIAF